MAVSGHALLDRRRGCPFATSITGSAATYISVGLHLLVDNRHRGGHGVTAGPLRTALHGLLNRMGRRGSRGRHRSGAAVVPVAILAGDSTMMDTATRATAAGSPAADWAQGPALGVWPARLRRSSRLLRTAAQRAGWLAKD